MCNLVTKVKKKLLEYGFDIYDQYKGSSNQYIFLVENMVIFLDLDTNDISISFQATTPPDIAANNILIIQEISEIHDISVMESFIFTKDKQIVKGKLAYEFIRKSVENQVIEKYNQQLMYISYLSGSKCYKC